MIHQIFRSLILATFYLCFLLLISHRILAQSEWTQNDRSSYQKSIKSEIEIEFKKAINSSKNETEKQASKLLLNNIDQFCNCSVKKLEFTFPKRKDFLDLNESAKGKKIQDLKILIATECALEVVNNNYEETREILIQSCVKGPQNKQQATFSKERMEQYCACALDKFYAKEKSFSKLFGKTTDEAISIMESEISSCISILKPDTQNKAVSGETGSGLTWTPALERIFIKSCADNIDNPNGKIYCECMIEEIKIKYPKYDDFIKLANNQDQFLTEFSNEIVECSKHLNKNNSNTDISSNATETEIKWTPALEKIFLKSCSDNLDERGNKKYCECMLDKIKIKYPKYDDFMKLVGNQELMMSELQEEIMECAKKLKGDKSK